MNSEDRKIRELLLKVDTTTHEHESKLHHRIMHQLPSRGLRRGYVVILFAILWGGSIALFIKYWRVIADALLTTTSALLDQQLPSAEALGIAALCIGAIVLVITQSLDVMDEYYEREVRHMLQGRV
ncbi:MAG: hypothetical protein IKT86_02920 [Bacteroidaceae bacterium]|nr:hypothetical protein [Bacteroidaceae bacterium]